MPKATHTHTHREYVIFIAFPRLQWLHERASMLRYTYIAFLVFFFFILCPTPISLQGPIISVFFYIYVQPQ